MTDNCDDDEAGGASNAASRWEETILDGGGDIAVGEYSALRDDTIAGKRGERSSIDAGNDTT